MAVPANAPNRRLVVMVPPYMEGPDVEAVQRVLHLEPDRWSPQLFGGFAGAVLRPYESRSLTGTSVWCIGR
jgi:hypothetical protein